MLAQLETTPVSNLVDEMWKGVDNDVDRLGRTCGIPAGKFPNALFRGLYIGLDPVYENWCGVSCQVAISGVLCCVGVAEKGRAG